MNRASEAGGRAWGALRPLLSGLATRDTPHQWRRLLKPGDWLTLGLGLAATAIAAATFWTGDSADRAIIRRDGVIVAELALDTPRRYEVEGALGVTTIEIQPGRARIQADPGPRQYCVQQGWLTRANAIAICAPSRLSLQLGGRGSHGGQSGYDSINY